MIQSLLHQVNTKEIPIPPWATPSHKITKAFKDGEVHAVNHWFDEEIEPDSMFKSWDTNPYTPNRPASFYSWLAGFAEKWAELTRGNQDPNS